MARHNLQSQAYTIIARFIFVALVHFEAQFLFLHWDPADVRIAHVSFWILDFLQFCRESRQQEKVNQKVDDDSDGESNQPKMPISKAQAIFFILINQTFDICEVSDLTSDLGVDTPTTPLIDWIKLERAKIN